MYTLTDVASQVIVDYALSESRDGDVIRELIAKHDPQLIISDGCQSIQAACGYFADKPHGRCWFHVIKAVLQRFSSKERERVTFDLRFLYRCTNLKDARWFLEVLKQRYAEDKLAALLKAWSQLELYWQYEAMPLTNNVSETLYSALWSRSKKRVVRAFHRALEWFKEARFRWHHHLVRGESPWQRFSATPAKPWLKSLLTPLKYSTDF
jgi:transposase-like protein